MTTADTTPLHRLSWAWLTLVSAEPIDSQAIDAGDLDAWRRIGIEVDGRACQEDTPRDRAAVQRYLDLATAAIAHHLQGRLVPDFDGAAGRLAKAGGTAVVWLVPGLA